MYAQNFVQDPTAQRLNELFTQLCSTGSNGKCELILANNCFQVVCNQKVTSQLCLGNFGFPSDSASLISSEILGGETLQLFDNNTETYFAGQLPENKAFVRGVILLVHYPGLDGNGVTIDPARMNVKIGITTLSIQEGSPNVTGGSAIMIQAPTNQVTLTASASPNSGATITKYKWTKVTAPLTDTSAILSPNTVSTKVNNLIPGEYVFQIDVTDSNDSVTTTTVTILVAGLTDTPPTITMMSPLKIQKVIGGSTDASLSASASANSPATSISTIDWTLVSGPQNVTITAGSTLLASATGMNTPGIYTFMLRVTDNLGFQAISSVTITVYSMQSISMPLHNFFSHFSNPVTLDPSMILDGMTITNMSSNMPICISALLINTKAAEQLNTTNNSCNC